MTRSLLLGATFLAAGLSIGVSRADTKPTPPTEQTMIEHHHKRAGMHAHHQGPENLDQRIANLHQALKITAAEEPDWLVVAQTMRDNAAAMQRLVADNMAVAPETVTAIDELGAFQKFAQAHVDGIKNLTASFAKLYATMPDPQKKLADQVFRTYGRKGPHHEG
jgi:hypothetical protein